VDKKTADRIREMMKGSDSPINRMEQDGRIRELTCVGSFRPLFS
jgi:hypothetical protein